MVPTHEYFFDQLVLESFGSVSLLFSLKPPNKKSTSPKNATLSKAHGLVTNVTSANATLVGSLVGAPGSGLAKGQEVVAHGGHQKNEDHLQAQCPQMYTLPTLGCPFSDPPLKVTNF